MSELELARQRITLLEHENAALRQTLVALRVARDRRTDTDTPPMGELPVDWNDHG